MAGARPPLDFASARLRLHTAAAGERYGRIYLARHPDPLGYGKSSSRFSDPRRRKDENRFGVLYLGETLTVCFLEAVLRDQRDAVIGELVMDESELETRLYAEILPREIAAPLPESYRPAQQLALAGFWNFGRAINATTQPVWWRTRETKNKE